MLQNIRTSIANNLQIFNKMSSEEIFENRKNKFLRIGRNKGFIENLEDISSLKVQTKSFYQIIKSQKIKSSIIITPPNQTIRPIETAEKISITGKKIEKYKTESILFEVYSLLIFLNLSSS